MDNYILLKGLNEETLIEKFAGMVLGQCSKFIYYDHPDYKKIHEYYWEDDQCKVVFYDDIMEKIINSSSEKDRPNIRKILTHVTRFKNIKLLDMHSYDYQTIITLAKSYVIDSYGVVRDMANNKIENINIPETRYPLGKHAGLLTQEQLSQIDLSKLAFMYNSKKKKPTMELNDIRMDRFDNTTLTIVGVKV